MMHVQRADGGTERRGGDHDQFDPLRYTDPADLIERQAAQPTDHKDCQQDSGGDALRGRPINGGQMFDPERDDDERDLRSDARPQMRQVLPRDVTGELEALAHRIGGGDAVRHEQRVSDRRQAEYAESDHNGGARQAIGE